MDNFTNEVKQLVVGWKVKDVLPGGVFKLVLENDNGNIRELDISCSDLGAWIENVVDNNNTIPSLDLMIEQIRNYILETSNNEEQDFVDLYGENTTESCWPLVKYEDLVPLEDVKSLRFGFKFRNDKEWWTTLSAVRVSKHPWKMLFLTPDGRKNVANLLCRNFLFDEVVKNSYEEVVNG